MNRKCKAQNMFVSGFPTDSIYLVRNLNFLEHIVTKRNEQYVHDAYIIFFIETVKRTHYAQPNLVYILCKDINYLPTHLCHNGTGNKQFSAYNYTI